MKKIQTSLVFIAIIFFLGSCGISKDVRTASTSLVAKQKASLDAHITFHQVTLSTLNAILEAEQARNKKTYEESVENYHRAMLDELKNIYENTRLSEAEKKVKEESTRQTIMGHIKKAEENKNTRERLISEARNKLLDASTQLIEGEKAKSFAIEKLNTYLHVKRPSERLLDLIDLDLENYTDHISQANQAIKQAEPFIEQLKIKK